jgi:hypothetical protein
MMSFEVTNPFPVFTDLKGEPLENGNIYIGTVLLNPETNPIVVYWDEALSIPATQPIRTLGGYPDRAGTPSRLYVAENSFSITVRDKNNKLVFSELGAAVVVTDVLFYDTIADMTAILESSLTNNQQVSVGGYAAIGDGGGGIFYWDSTSAATANGGTIFASDEGGTGRWFRIYEGTIHSKWFNVKTDGVTDDTAAINNIGAALVSGDSVQFAKGETVISTAGVAVDWNGKSDIEVFGEGAILLTPSGVTTSRPFVIRNSSNITVHHLHFKCEIPLGGQACDGLDLQNVTDAHVHDCFFEGQTFYGLAVIQDTIAPLNGSCAGLRVHDCYFKDIGSIALEPFPKVTEGSCTIVDNTFENCGNTVSGGGTGNALKIGQGFDDATATGNTFINCGGFTSALAVGFYSRVTVSDNDFFRCPNINIAMSISVHGLGDEGTMESLIVDDNRFHANDADAGGNGFIELATSTAGLVIYDANKGTISVTDNKVNNTSLTRVFALIRPQDTNNVARFTFSGNKGNFLGNSMFLSDDSRTGILIDPMIDDNKVRMSDTSTAIPIICINADGGFITNNTIIEADKQAISAGIHLNKQYISGNKFFKCNTSATAATSAMLFATEGGYTPADLFVYGNIMDPTDYEALTGVSVAYNLHHANNVCPKVILTSTAVEFAEMTFGEHTSSSDVAVNGYVEIKDQFGATRKLSTIA